jgi:hypothetical protein
VLRNHFGLAQWRSAAPTARPIPVKAPIRA